MDKENPNLKIDIWILFNDGVNNLIVSVSNPSFESS